MKYIWEQEIFITKMRIAINGMYLTNQAVGIANVIINVANQLVKKHEITIFANKQVLPEIKQRLDSSITYCENHNKLFFRKPIWFFLKFPKLLNSNSFDLLWNPAVWSPLFLRKKMKNIVTVHDFVSKDYKETMRFFNRIISNAIEKYSIKNADYLWCVSEYTRNKLEDYYPVRRCSNIFTGSAPDPFIRKINEPDFLSKIKNELQLPSHYMLFVGSLEPRKNLKFLLQLFKDYSMKNGDIDLVIVGARGWGKTDIADIINSEGYPRERVFFTGFVTEEQLLALYNLASLYISTSLNEGFGLPQVEAMNCEIPVISPHNSAMIEVVSNAGITVVGWEFEKWENAINLARENREEIIKQQNERRKKYQWEDIITRLYEYLGF